MPRGRGRGRGGRGRYGGGIPRGVYYADPMGLGMGMPGVQAHVIGRSFPKKIHSYRIPFKAIEEGTIEFKLVAVNPNNLECFHGYQSIFSTQYHHDFLLDGKLYKSVDHYYQRKKVEQITGSDSERFDDPKVKNFGNLAREILKLHNISRKTIDQWRVSCGVEVVQKALLERVRQSPELKDAILATGDKIIVHTFANDDFFGAGCPFKYVKDWSSGMEKNKIQVKIITSQLDQLSVTLSPVSNYVIPETYIPRPMKMYSNGASAPTSRPGDIDFTMDYEEDSITAAQAQAIAQSAAVTANQVATSPVAIPAQQPVAVPIVGTAAGIPGTTGKVKAIGTGNNSHYNGSLYSSDSL